VTAGFANGIKQKGTQFIGQDIQLVYRQLPQLRWRINGIKEWRQRPDTGNFIKHAGYFPAAN
jgi:hypothetical protein